MDTPTIIIRPLNDSWQVFDLQGGVTTYRWREVAVAAAYGMFGATPGLIVVGDSHGHPLETIDLSEQGF